MFNKKRIKALELENMRLNSQINKVLLRIARITKIYNKNVDLANDNIKKVDDKLAEIKSDVDKSSKKGYSTAIYEEEHYYRATFKDGKGNIIHQVEVTPNRINITAEKIVLDDIPNFKGVTISSDQI